MRSVLGLSRLCWGVGVRVGGWGRCLGLGGMFLSLDRVGLGLGLVGFGGVVFGFGEGQLGFVARNVGFWGSVGCVGALGIGFGGWVFFWDLGGPARTVFGLAWDGKGFGLRRGGSHEHTTSTPRAQTRHDHEHATTTEMPRPRA